MANIEKTVKIVFAGEDKDLSRSIQGVAKKFDDLSGVANKIVTPLASAADSILKLDAALAAMAVGGLGFALKAAGDFNGKFGEITTLISDTGAPIDKFKGDIKNYAMDSVKSIDDINQAIYTAVSAGVGYKDSIKFINEAEKLSVAGRSSLGDTTKVLISVLNAYGQSTDQAGKYSDIMFATVKGGLTTMTELSGSLAQVTGLSANAGIPFETLSAAIATLTSTGMPTTQAITSLKAAIQAIIKPTGEAEVMAKSLGLQFDASTLKTKGFEGVLWDAWRATGGSTAKMSELFGSVEALNSVLVLASDKTGKFKQELMNMSTSAGGVVSAYSKVVDEFDNINQRLENSFKITLGSIGEKIMPEYGDIAGSLAEFLKGIKVGLDEGAFDPLFNQLSKYGSRIAETLRTIAENMPEAMEGLDFSALIKSLDDLGGSLGEAFKSIFGDVDLTTVEGLHEVIQKIINAFAKLVDVTKGIVDGMDPLFKAIGLAVKGFDNMDSSTAKMVGTVLGAAKGISTLADYAGVLTGALSILAGKALIDTTAGIVKLGGSAVSAIPGITAYIASLGTLGSLGALGAAAGVGVLTGTLLNQVPAVQNGAQALLELLDVNNDYFGALPGGKKEMDKNNLAFDAAVIKARELAQSLKDVPAETKAKIALDTKEFEDWKTRMQASSNAFNLSLKPVIDLPALKEAENTILGKFGGGQMIKITANLDGSSTIEQVDKFKKAFSKETKAEDKLDITKTTIAETKGKSDNIQKSLEFKAKIDTAEIESGTKVMEAAFNSVNASIASTGQTLTDLGGTYAAATAAGKGGTAAIEQEMREESRRRNETITMQKALVEAQVDNLKGRTEAMKNGGAMIEIDGKGLQPQLEAFMFEVLKAIQVRANAEGAQYLVGL